MVVFPVALSGCIATISSRYDVRIFDPNTEAIKRRLLRKGVFPTPKIIHTLRKKEMEKYLRRTEKLNKRKGVFPLNECQRKELEENETFLKATAEYRAVMAEANYNTAINRELVGSPWKRPSGLDMVKLGSETEGFTGKKLKFEHLEELRKVLVERNGEILRWFTDDADIESFEDCEEESRMKGTKRRYSMEMVSDDEKVRLLVRRLISANLSLQDWKFASLMRHSGLLFNELCMLDIIKQLEAHRNWKQALYVVKWVYNQHNYKDCKSRYVLTKLMSVLGNEQRHSEALKIFNMMTEDSQTYPDMAAYHSIAVTLGQAGLVKEIIQIIECMKKKPSIKLKNRTCMSWDPCLDPDIIIYNALLNACIPSRQWKGVSWVLNQMRISGLRPVETTYGLAMTVMLEAGKYELVHKFFKKMQKKRLAPNALSYKVLVRTYWKEGKIDEALAAVRDMEQRGVIGIPSVYYELACCLCNNGRWIDATLEVENLKRLARTKPLEVTFTGMILAALDGGYIDDCISIYEYMKDHCNPNIGTINVMLKVYGRSDMFAKAKQLFESVKDIYMSGEASSEATSLKPDAYTFTSMLEASASACQWEFFDHVYKEMVLRGYRLNFYKHSWLLIEASKAGKGHLLEHAFDACLESGEIPHCSLFTEMLCLAIIQQRTERVEALLSGMAAASLLITENQWSDLFQRNMDRLGLDRLHCLLTQLRSSCATERPIPSLLKSLESLCKPSSLGSEKEQTAEVPLALTVGSETPAPDFMFDQLNVDTGNLLSSSAPSAADILESWKVLK